MNNIDTILTDIQTVFGLDNLDQFEDFRITKSAVILEVVAPSGVVMTIIDTGTNFSLYTAHIDNFDKRTFEVDSLTMDAATNILTGFIAFNV